MTTRNGSAQRLLAQVVESIEAVGDPGTIIVPLKALPFHVKHALRDALREFTSENNKPEHFECSCDLCGQYTQRVAEISQWARMGM